MTGKDLINNLRELKNKRGDNQFLNDNRQLLLAQISNSGTEELSAWKRFVISFENLAKTSARPVVSVATFILVILSVGIFGTDYLQSSKPNDSLYIARVFSEKLKVNTTFDEINRDKLASKYALSHAEDIVLILSDESFHSEENSQAVARLTEDFKEEINKASLSISNLEKNNTETFVAVNTDTEKNNDNDEEEKEINNNIEENGEDDLMMIAENNKEENGIEIAISNNNEQASSSEEIIEQELAQIEEKLNGTSSQDIFLEITTLFEEKRFQEAREKLVILKESLK